MSETLNIYQKLAKIRKQVEVVKKNKAGFNYKYVTDDELLAKITALMDKYGLSLIPQIVPETMMSEQYCYTKTKYDKSTKQTYEENINEIIVSADMTYTWVNNNNPGEKVVVPWVTIGQQSDSSQALGSGLTYSMRYFLLKFFNIATPEDDVDNWRSKQRAAEEAEEMAIAEETITQLDNDIKLFLTDNPGESENVKKLVSKYVKDGNYFEMTEPVLAAKLLSDFRKTFLGEEK